MTYTMEDFQRDSLRKLFDGMPPHAQNAFLESLPLRKRAAHATLEQVEELLKQLRREHAAVQGIQRDKKAKTKKKK